MTEETKRENRQALFAIADQLDLPFFSLLLVLLLGPVEETSGIGDGIRKGSISRGQLIDCRGR